MNLRIWHKLFIALLAANGFVVAAALFLSGWSLNQGFIEYLNNAESRRVDDLAVQLGQLYAQSGGWALLENERELWATLMDDYTGGFRPRDREPFGEAPPRGDLRPGGRPGGRPPEPGFPPPPPGAGAPLPIRHRAPLDLLDINRQVLFGRPGPRPDTILKPILNGGKVVGYLRYVLVQAVADLEQSADLAFLEQQRQSLYLIAAIVTLIAGLIALLLARQLLKPIRVLARAAHSVAAGQLDARITHPSGDELGQLATDFNAMAETLEQGRVARRQWVADISHELRTPLAILAGELQAVEDGVRPWNEDTRVSLQSEVGRLSKLVEDLHALAMSDSGGMGYESSQFDLNNVAERALESCQGRIREAGLRLETRLTATPLHVQGDPRRMQQVVFNVLENSCRYTSEGGLLRITSSVDGASARLTLEDSAPGVPDEALEKLFERLFRAESSRNRGSGGSGLGLAICQGIVEAHGGCIQALHSPPGGVRIELELPRV